MCSFRFSQRCCRGFTSLQECDAVFITLEVARVRSSFIYKGLADEGTTVLSTVKTTKPATQRYIPDDPYPQK